MAWVEFSEYKGSPMIVLRRSKDDRYPFQFGISKARLIVEAAKEIEKWVKDIEAKAEAEAATENKKGGEDAK